MMGTVTNLGIFHPKLIREFIVNLPTDFNEPNISDFWKVHVHGKCISVSPELLNTYLNISAPAGPMAEASTSERLALEMSSGLVRTWPTYG